MDCLNSWQCIDACYKTGLLENFSKCDCFGEIPNLDNDKDGHLTLLADEEHYYEPTNIAYVTNVNGGFQEKFEIIYLSLRTLWRILQVIKTLTISD